MKYILLILTLILILSCQKNDKSDLIGTWNKCNENGEYFEWKISEKNVLMFGLIKNDIAIFNNRIENNSLIIKSLNIDLPNNTDTLILISKSKSQIILQRNYNGEILELRKMENMINEIDSIESDKWRKQNIKNFQKRADLYNCLDNRSDDKKTIYDFGEIESRKEIESPVKIE